MTQEAHYEENNYNLSNKGISDTTKYDFVICTTKILIFDLKKKQ